MRHPILIPLLLPLPPEPLRQPRPLRSTRKWLLYLMLRPRQRMCQKHLLAQGLSQQMRPTPLLLLLGSLSPQMAVKFSHQYQLQTQHLLHLLPLMPAPSRQTAETLQPGQTDKPRLRLTLALRRMAPRMEKMKPQRLTLAHLTHLGQS